MPATLEGVAPATAPGGNSVATPTTLTPSITMTDPNTAAAVTRQNGETILCFTTCRTATPTVATPTGWVSVLNVTGANGRLVIFAKQVDGTETAPSVVWSGLATGNAGSPVQAQCALVRGLFISSLAPVIDVLGAVSDQASSTTVYAGGAGITTTQGGTFVLVLGTRQDDAGTVATLPASDSVTWARIGYDGTTHGADKSQIWSYGRKIVAGSIAAKSWSISGTSTSAASSGVIVALRERPIPPLAENRVPNPVAAVDTAGWAGVGMTHDTTWGRYGGTSVRFQGNNGAGALIGYTGVFGGNVRVDAGKLTGYRVSILARTNAGGMYPFVSWYRANDTLISTARMGAPPRDKGTFTGTGEWEFRALSNAPTDAVYGLFGIYNVNGGAFDVSINGAMVSQALVDREATRAGEGYDVPPFGFNGAEFLDWEAASYSGVTAFRRRNAKVNYVRNPRGVVDATKLAGYMTDAADAPILNTRFTPTATTDSDVGACHEWTFVAPATGSVRLYMGDLSDIPGTAMPVSEQEFSVFSGRIKIVSGPTPTNTFALLDTFLLGGQYAYVKGYSAAGVVGTWQTMGLTGMEEFPADATAAAVPNTPPRWAIASFSFSGMTAGSTYVVRTTQAMMHPDTAETYPNDLAYFDGDYGTWLGTSHLSASRIPTDVPLVNEQTRDSITQVSGSDTTDVTINHVSPFMAYELRRVSSTTAARTDGTQIEAATIASTKRHVVTVTRAELLAAGATDGTTSIIKAFTQDASTGVWSS